LPSARAQSPQTASPPLWHVGDAPPSIAGIHLGDTLQTVVAVLGAPDPGPLTPDDPADRQTLSYRGGALLLLLGKSEGVLRMQLRKPEGGDLAGIRVGDPAGALVEHWGKPPAGHGSVGLYAVGTWAVRVRAGRTVVSIMLIRLPSQPAAASATPPSAAAPAP
jgi:hypothetical protein